MEEGRHRSSHLAYARTPPAPRYTAYGRYTQARRRTGGSALHVEVERLDGRVVRRGPRAPALVFRQRPESLDKGTAPGTDGASELHEG